MPNDAHHFTDRFQRELAGLLLQDPKAFEYCPASWNPDYFDQQDHRDIVRAYLGVRYTSNEHAGETILSELLINGSWMPEDRKEAPLTFDQEKLLAELKTLLAIKISNPQAILQHYNKWAKHRALLQALDQGITLWKEGRTWEMVTLINQAYLSGGESPKLAGPSFYHDPPNRAAQVIPGVLQRGFTGILSSSSKAFKSWNALALGIASATGKAWLGFDPCPAGRTLYVNLEMEEEEFKVRVDMVAKAMDTTREALEEKLDFLHFYGYPTDLNSVLMIIRAFYRPECAVAANHYRPRLSALFEYRGIGREKRRER